jgi:hypothetical protein
MRIWELGGWLLVLIGLFFFYSVYALLVSREPRIFEAGPIMVFGIVVFRGGIHLLKVAAAARACRDMQTKGLEVKNAPPRGRSVETKLDPASRR